jgi:L-lactate dehydrogenase complex protein LldF
MGISGVNFGVAETGTIAIVTNEGNASLTVSAPRIHVAMMGIERLVPTLDDLTVMLELLARSATGQKLTVYTDLLTGPRHDEQDGPEELHVVLVDNGRSGLLGTSMAEVLACIRCGACLNVCPVYREIGGHAYGSVYPGPIGAVLTPAIGGLERWEALPMASSLCGACRDACPVRIDLPRMLLELRAKRANANQLPLWLKVGLKLYAATATRPQLFRVMVSVTRWVLGKFSTGGWLRWLPAPLSGWTCSRDFPVFADQSFSEQWQSRRTN